MSVGLDDYKFGQKNNWRARVWNEIDRRLRGLGTHPRDAVVLYLPGIQDLDRAVALRHGFRAMNLIAVEDDPKVAADLRRRGVLVVGRSLDRVLDGWNHVRYPLDVIHADLCTCVSEGASRVFREAIDALERRSGVLVVNLLRGREQGFRREIVAGLREPYGPVHRAQLLVLELLYLRYRQETWGAKLGVLHVGEIGGILKWFEHWTTRAEMLDLSYRSNKSTMDSVVLTVPRRESTFSKRQLRDDEVARSIAATMAHRTRRLGEMRGAR